MGPHSFYAYVVHCWFIFRCWSIITKRSTKRFEKPSKWPTGQRTPRFACAGLHRLRSRLHPETWQLVPKPQQQMELLAAMGLCCVQISALNEANPLKHVNCRLHGDHLWSIALWKNDPWSLGTRSNGLEFAAVLPVLKRYPHGMKAKHHQECSVLKLARLSNDISVSRYSVPFFKLWILKNNVSKCLEWDVPKILGKSHDLNWKTYHHLPPPVTSALAGPRVGTWTWCLWLHRSF